MRFSFNKALSNYICPRSFSRWYWLTSLSKAREAHLNHRVGYHSVLAPMLVVRFHTSHFWRVVFHSEPAEISLCPHILAHFCYTITIQSMKFVSKTFNVDICMWPNKTNMQFYLIIQRMIYQLIYSPSLILLPRKVFTALSTSTPLQETGRRKGPRRVSPAHSVSGQDHWPAHRPLHCSIAMTSCNCFLVRYRVRWTAMQHLTRGICSEKRVASQFGCCTNITERSYTNLDGLAYITHLG